MFTRVTTINTSIAQPREYGNTGVLIKPYPKPVQASLKAA
jgi:hypothetical protein